MPSLVKATFWSAIQRFGGLAIGFISNIVLARLLCPEDYGIVGLIMVFVGFADVLVDGGLGNALIQKKEISQDDISTVFSSNLGISIFLFLILYVTAPSIATYVEVENFALYLRVEAVMILLRAFYVIHFSLLNREMNFQKLASISLGVNAFSTLIAISMAFCGCGVWSLIVRNLCLDLFSLIAYYIFCKFSFSFHINKESFHGLFGFAFFIAFANLLESLYSNLLSFILGKKFSVIELGYYNQAYSLEQIPVYSVTAILNQVFFPFLSKEQENLDKMRVDLERSIKSMSFFVYPMMFYLICFAKPIIVILYSEKWLPAVPFFQILCILGFTNFLYHLNRSVLKAVGESKKLFYSQVLVCCIGVVLIMLSMPFGIKTVVASVALNSVIGLMIVVLYTGKKINFGLFYQFKAILTNFIFALIAGVLSFIVFGGLSLNNILTVSFSFILYSFIYLVFHLLFKSSPYGIVKSVILNYKK